jgi:hypothetical protein
VTDTTEQAPPLHYQGQLYSPESAAAKLAELDADKDFVKAALGGDVAKQQERAAYREMARGRQPGAVPTMPADAGAVVQQQDEREQQIHEARLDAFAKHVRMTPELRFQMSRRLATQEQSDFAKAERVRLLKDSGFRAKVYANDADAIDRWIKITQVAAAPVAPPDYKWE